MSEYQSLTPADEFFPAEVVHVGNPAMRLQVVAYGVLSTPYGAVPVVAKLHDDLAGDLWFAGEADVIDGVPTLLAVNGYGDETTARQYALSIYVL